jgi:hypothetical protein
MNVCPGREFRPVSVGEAKTGASWLACHTIFDWMPLLTVAKRLGCTIRVFPAMTKCVSCKMLKMEGDPGRRGLGREEPPWQGIDPKRYAKDFDMAKLTMPWLGQITTLNP